MATVPWVDTLHEGSRWEAVHMVDKASHTTAAAVGLAGVVVAWGATRCGDGRFWLDEAYTAAIAHQPLGSVVDRLGHEGGMGPYYFALWAWAHLGTSEWWLRLVSVAGGAAAVAAVFLFTARTVGRRAAAMAVALMVCNPFFLYYFTELRAYTWSMFAAVAATWAFVRLRERPTIGRAVGYGIAAGMSLALLAFSVGLVVAHALCSRRLLRSAEGRRALGVAAGVTAVVFAPWVKALVTSDQLDWIAPTNLHRTITTIVDALGGRPWVFAFAGGMVLLAAQAVAHRRRPHPSTDVVAVVLAGCVAVPLTLVALSVATPLLLARYMAPLLPLAAIAAAAGLVGTLDAVVAARPWRIAAVAAAIGGCAVAAPGSPFTDVPRPEDLYGPAAQLAREVRPGDGVTFGEPLEALAMGWYWRSPADPAGDPCRTWVVSRDVGVLEAATAVAPTGAAVTVTGYDGWGVVLIDACG